ncbi:flagellar basal-body rod protein FlgF [Aquabacterium sp. A08]|uniref:flagellar basal-body rod protein FlgF n=1 Tax=Aquabacterium sp. A08 TaxID=2718532 RepID=UPI0014212402|nr:flagellar basal-body rod protein FlgF [Aquabacterium sp. A08]NIC40211.1 flagellar basal-body rod protein FlgF [Aquabacterium sp. A08]
MDRVIYTALSGASAAMHRQQVLSHNLANVNTNGFRAEMATFRAVPLRGEGANTRVHALEATAGHLDTPGSMNSTGRNLDVAAVGAAYFAIQGLDGTEAYTRAGALQVSAQGQLVGHAGLPMLDAGGAPIDIPDNARVAIASDGTVSAQVGNEPVQAVGRLKLVTPNAAARLQRGDDGLFRSADGGALPQDPAAQLADGMLEGSNVNPIEAMVGMIGVARQYELQMRLLQNAEKSDQAASQLLSLNG